MTLTLFSRKAAFIGDPRFPSSALSYYKGGRIQFFQYLYEKYSTLAFSFNSDRPIAIRGLERRLLKAFETTGGYGVFRNYLGRSLLWQRRDSYLCRIDFPCHRMIPSWSWMAYKGSIRYMDIPFGAVEWSTDVDMIGVNDSAYYEEALDGTSSSYLQLFAIVRPVQGATESNGSFLIFDQSRASRLEDLPLLSCIVVGKQKSESKQKDQMHFVLLVYPKWAGYDTYERIGVGLLFGEYIGWSSSTERICIQ